MPSKLSVFGLVALALPLVRAQEPSYAGCQDTRPADLEAIIPFTGDALACDAHCRNLNYLYAFYQFPSGTECGCRLFGLTSNEFVYPNDNNALLCDATQWSVDVTWTTFTTPSCIPGYNPGQPEGPAADGPNANALLSFSTQVADLGECFRYCRAWEGASYAPNGDLFDCQCDSSSATFSDNIVLCTAGTRARYSHAPNTDTGVQPAGQSVWVKRSIRDQLRMQQQGEAGKLCPGHARACLTSPGAKTWECVETDTELESCGGCAYGEFGARSTIPSSKIVDCTSLPGVSMGGVTCERGQCSVLVCEDGFRLEDNECVATAQEIEFLEVISA